MERIQLLIRFRRFSLPALAVSFLVFILLYSSLTEVRLNNQSESEPARLETTNRKIRMLRENNRMVQPQLNNKAIVDKISDADILRRPVSRQIVTDTPSKYTGIGITEKLDTITEATKDVDNLEIITHARIEETSTSIPHSEKRRINRGNFAPGDTTQAVIDKTNASKITGAKNKANKRNVDVVKRKGLENANKTLSYRTAGHIAAYPYSGEKDHPTNTTNTCIYSHDYVPDLYKTTVVSGTVHFCLVAAKKQVANEVAVLVKSIILHARRSDVFFHFLVSEGAEETVPLIFEDIKNPFVNVSYEFIKMDMKDYAERKLKNVTMTHAHSSYYGIVKLFMYDILKHVDKCILLDTDFLFGIDPAFLWHELKSKLQPPVAMAIAYVKEDGYFNSGLLLQDLKRMREIKFGDFISMKTCEKVTENETETFYCYHDQLLLNQILKDHPEVFDTSLPISWHLDNCNQFRFFKFSSFEEKMQGLFFGTVHLDCMEVMFANNAFTVYKVFSHSGNNFAKYIEFLQTLDLKNLAENLVHYTVSSNSSPVRIVDWMMPAHTALQLKCMNGRLF